MTTAIAPAMPGRSLPDWQTWLENGDRYLAAAAGKKGRFDTALRYNLLSMALEGYVMAISDFHSLLPDNHTYTDLMDALERVAPLAPDLKEQILAHESIQQICSIEDYHRSHPTETALADLRQAIEQVASMAHETCLFRGSAVPQA